MAPRELVLAAGMAAGSGQSWQPVGATARQDGQAEALARGPCPGVPHVGTSSGRWTGWDVRGRDGTRLGETSGVGWWGCGCAGTAGPVPRGLHHRFLPYGDCTCGQSATGLGWCGSGAAGLRHRPADPALALARRCSHARPCAGSSRGRAIPVSVSALPREMLWRGWTLPPAVGWTSVPAPSPAALHINPPGSSCHPAGRWRAGPAPRRHPRLAAWSWRCRPPGWRWRRGAGSRRRDLRSEGQTWGAVAAPGAPPAPRGVPGEEGTG